MRVVTLLPAATEIVAVLGAADQLVGISHECDWPPDLALLPRVTATPVDRDAPSGTIDAQVRSAMAAGRPVIGVSAAQLKALAPDLIITQDLCEVCAVGDGEVHRLATALVPAPAILSLGARDLDGIWRDIRAVAAALGAPARGERVIGQLEERLARLRAARPSGTAPRVVCIEWLDPPYLAGHWVPELVEAAGGVDVGASAGSHSVVHPWNEIAALEPDHVALLLCGMDLPRVRLELERFHHPVAAELFATRPVWLLDGNAYTSRPGPRVVDGAERFQGILEGRAMPGLERWR